MVGVAVVVGSCASSTARIPGSIDRPTRTVPGTSDVPTRLRVRVAGRITTVTLEDYVLGAALSEVTPTGVSDRAAATVYEVQGVIARTYAAAHIGRHAAEGFDLCDQTHCQLYQPSRLQTSSFGQVARQAVARTAGRILLFAGRPADTVFHADCGGATTNPADAWGGPALPYLPTQTDKVPGLTHRTWAFTAPVREWTQILRADARTDPGGTVSRLRIIDRDKSGRATSIEIGGPSPRTVSGDTFRTVVTGSRGIRSIMSTRFSIAKVADGYRVEGSGFGHGVGLCQIGALARSKRGDSAGQILAHYYPGAQFSR